MEWSTIDDSYFYDLSGSRADILVVISIQEYYEGIDCLRGCGIRSHEQGLRLGLAVVHA